MEGHKDAGNYGVVMTYRFSSKLSAIVVQVVPLQCPILSLFMLHLADTVGCVELFPDHMQNRHTKLK